MLVSVSELDIKLSIVFSFFSVLLLLEFGKNYIIKVHGTEYEQLSTLKKFNPTLLVPVNFPAAFDVDDPFLTQKISLNKMRYWNQAPANPKAIADAGIKFAFTSSDLKSLKSFLPNIKKAVQHGLSPERAIAYIPNHVLL